MSGGDEHHVVNAFVGDCHIGHVERLRIDLPINGVGKEFAEGIGVDIRMGEDGLVEVLTAARIVVVVGEHIDLSQRVKRHRAVQRTGDQAEADKS